MGSELISKYKELTSLVEGWLEPSIAGESALSDAMRYSVLGGGKRFRPVLSLLVAEVLGVEKPSLKSWCLALEFLHAASLIHDDLPALDDDDLRRGQPSCHKAFGEATAVLAGDALIARASQIIADASELSDVQSRALLSLISGATLALCYGQEMDLEAELALHENGEDAAKKELELRHRQKTGALIAAAALAPACLLNDADGSLAELKSVLEQYGYALGMLFQITDDILDATSDTETMGKTVRSDAEQGTPTFVSLYGLEESRAIAGRCLEEAIGCSQQIGAQAFLLGELARYVSVRKN